MRPFALWIGEWKGSGWSISATGKRTEFTLVYYDSKAGRYRWNGYDSASGAVETEVKLVDGGLEWSVAAGGRGATVRFTIHFDEKRWHEVGEVSVDGRTWSRFMEMNLARR